MDQALAIVLTLLAVGAILYSGFRPRRPKSGATRPNP